MKKHLLVFLILVSLVSAGFLVPRDAYASSCETIHHRVKAGENLTQIARHYGVTVSSIVKANNLWNPNLIYVGQVLIIPLPCKTPPPITGCTTTHTVKKGEYLKSIAARYGTTWQAIAQLNGIKSPYIIHPGQHLKIPIKCQDGSGDNASKPWTGKFWANRYLSGNPKFTKQYSKVDFGWGKSGPGGGIGGTNFAARFTRSRYFDAGTYRFSVKVDDGVRVWLDGILIIDQWHDTAPKTYNTKKQLSAGNHSLQIDYYQNTGGAQVKFWIDRVDGEAAWKGGFYNNTNLGGDPSVVKYYDVLAFDWTNKAPANGITADYFSARFTGEYQFSGGKYRFIATADDGIRVWIDDQLILDQWHITSIKTYTVDVDVSAGKHTVKVEYFENTGRAVCKLKWTQQ